MYSTAQPDPGSSPSKRRFSPVVWGVSALGALVLVLGVSGTLSSWTSAIITNGNNTVDSTSAVSLKETSGALTCDTTTTTTNTATCSSINKYGGTGTPLNPDNTPVGSNTRSVSVTLENTGTGTGALTLDPATCDSTAVSGATGSDPTTFPLCNKLTVTLACTGGIATGYALGPVVLSDASYQGVPLAIGSLDATEATVCTFTLNLPSGTPAGYASQVASQVLVWTLTATP